MRERLRKRRRKIAAKLPGLTRRGRLVRNLACVLLLAVLCWVLLGAPALTEAWAFRRAERRNLVGPSEILQRMDVDWDGFDYHRLIAAKNDWGYVLYAPDRPYAETELIYQAKMGDVTLMAPPEMWIHEPVSDQPLVLFTDLAAARAQVELTLTPALSSSVDLSNVTCRADADRRSGGFFLFVLSSESREEQQRFYESDALQTLAAALRGKYSLDPPVPVTVRLWDRAGTLIYEDTLRIGSQEVVE